MIELLIEKKAHRKADKTESEPICIEEMSFQTPLGPNGTVINMVSATTGREQNPPHPETIMQLLTVWRKL